MLTQMAMQAELERAREAARQQGASAAREQATREALQREVDEVSRRYGLAEIVGVPRLGHERTLHQYQHKQGSWHRKYRDNKEDQKHALLKNAASSSTQTPAP